VQEKPPALLTHKLRHQHIRVRFKFCGGMSGADGEAVRCLSLSNGYGKPKPHGGTETVVHTAMKGLAIAYFSTWRYECA
jgi:hypothetical protein